MLRQSASKWHTWCIHIPNCNLAEFSQHLRCGTLVGTWNSFQDNGSINSKATVAPHRVAFHDLTCWRLDLCLRIRPGVRPAMKTCRPSTCQRKHSFKICPKKKARWSTQFQWCCKGREAQQRTTETNPSISSNLTSISTIHHSLVAPVDVASPNSLAPTGTKRAHSAARLIQSLPRACPKGCTESFLPWKSTPASCLTAWTAKSSVSNSLGCQNMSCDLSTMLKNQGKTTTARTASTFFQHIQHLSNSASLLGRIDTEAEVLFCHSFENDHYLDHGRCAQTWLAQFWRPIPAKLLTRQRKLHLRNLTLPMTWTPRLICGYAATHGYTMLRC